MSTLEDAPGSLAELDPATFVDNYAYSNIDLPPNGLMEITTYRQDPQARTLTLWGEGVQPQQGETFITPISDSGEVLALRVGETRRGATSLRGYRLIETAHGLEVVGEPETLTRRKDEVLDVPVGKGYVKKVESVLNLHNVLHQTGSDYLAGLNLTPEQDAELRIVPQALEAIRLHGGRAHRPLGTAALQ